MTRWSTITATVLLAVIIALAFAYPSTMVSPGPLVTAHAELATDCFVCHAPFRGPSAQRCMTCHAPTDIGRRTTKGIPIVPVSGRLPFHEMLASQSCIACHSDHLEPFFATSKMTRFDHSLLTATVRNQCTACHNAPEDKLHRPQTSTCAQCHSQDHWKPATFDHGKLFVLDEHHRTSCQTCHRDSNYEEYTCFGCHKHQSDRMRAKHGKKGIHDIDNCVSCHRNANEQGSDSREGD
jgi:hypothetical protein